MVQQKTPTVLIAHLFNSPKFTVELEDNIIFTTALCGESSDLPAGWTIFSVDGTVFYMYTKTRVDQREYKVSQRFSLLNGEDMSLCKRELKEFWERGGSKGKNRVKNIVDQIKAAKVRFSYGSVTPIVYYCDPVQQDIPIESSMPFANFLVEPNSSNDSLRCVISNERTELFSGWVIMTVNGIDLCVVSRIITNPSQFKFTQTITPLTLATIVNFISELQDTFYRSEDYELKKKIIAILDRLERLKESYTPQTDAREESVTKMTQRIGSRKSSKE